MPNTRNLKRLLLGAALISAFVGCETSSKRSKGSPSDRQPQSEQVAFCMGLDDKLQAHARLMDSAREEFVQRVAVKNQPFTRDEWNAMLTPQGGCAFTTADAEALRKEQDADEALAREAAKKFSAIKLDKIRADMKVVEKFCAEIPKGGMLHEHANGTMKRETAKEILEKINPPIDAEYMYKKATEDQNVELFPEEVAWISKLKSAGKKYRYSELSPEDQAKLIGLFFLPKAPYDHSFKRFSYPFLIFPLMRDKAKPEMDPDYMQLVAFLKRAHSMGIRYVELTKGVKLDSASLAKLHEMAESLRAETGVIVRWNFAFFRNADASKNGDLALQLLSALEIAPSQEIVGVDLLANEETAPALESGQQSYAPVLAAALGKSQQFHTRLRRTFHAGELGLVENVRDALVMGAERVGHGVRLNQDPVTLEYARQMKLGVEVSPVSNLRLRVVKSLKEHPFLRFLRLGLKVSLSTDDEGVLETDMNNECVQVVTNTDVQYSELKQMAYNSIETSFASDSEKAELLKWLNESFTAFEKLWIR